MKKAKYCIGILLISFLFHSNLCVGKNYRDLYGDKKVLLLKSCISIDYYRFISLSLTTKNLHNGTYLEEKRPLFMPDTVLFRERYKVPFDLSRVVRNKHDRKEYYKQSKEGEKLLMTCISYEQANLFFECLTKIFNSEIPTQLYSLPTLKDYEVALKKNMLKNGAEYLADGNIVIIDTKNKKLEVVTTTDMSIRFRMAIHKNS